MFGFTAFSEAPFSSLGGAGTAVSLTGVQGTGQVGNVDYSPKYVSITGIEVPTGVGNVDYSPKYVSITGIEVPTGVGNVDIITPNSLSSVTGTGQVGTVGTTKSGSIALTGVSGTGQVGNVGVFRWVVIDTSEAATWAVIDNSM